MFNEWYLRDSSRKIKNACRQKGMNGKHLTSNVIYGYKKDPADKNHWIIDDEAAEVVRRIFRLTVEGYGPDQIAKLFTEEKIARPSYYLAQRGCGIFKNRPEIERPFSWAASTIRHILNHPEYMGHTVNFRSSQENYKDKQRRWFLPEEWVVFENTQEPIVDEQTWHLAQELRKTKRRVDKHGEANPLTGLVYCADCGARMFNHRNKSSAYYKDLLGRPTDKKIPDKDDYNCSTYNNGKKLFENRCSQHYIRTVVLRELILAAIRSVSRYAVENEKEFVKKVREASVVQKQSVAKGLQNQLKRERKRCKELDGLIKKLYEAYATGKLAEKRFEMLLAEYEGEQAGLEENIAKVQAALDVYNEDTVNVEQFMELAKRYTDFSELTTPMINEFIEKILVHEADKSSGERVQEVEIYFKFIGKFELPQPEPTPEEIAANQKRIANLIKKRESVRRYRERKKQAMLQELAEQENQDKQAEN